MLAQASTPNTATDVSPGVNAAAATVAGRYVADNPRQWIGQNSVGTGECVPLVQQATGAPRATAWRPGAQVQGNTNIRPGTAIATFDSNGRYDGHAAIYLGQDEHGIQVIDQWNRRDHVGRTIGQHPPSERPSTLGSQRGHLSIGESSIMSLSGNLAPCLIGVWLLAGPAVIASGSGIGCPPSNKGKPLKDVELFEGPPSDKAAIMPEIGRFVVPQTPRSLWDRFPNFTLGCTYRASTEALTVVLPRYIRVCDFTDGPQVRCH